MRTDTNERYSSPFPIARRIRPLSEGAIGYTINRTNKNGPSPDALKSPSDNQRGFHFVRSLLLLPWKIVVLCFGLIAWYLHSLFTKFFKTAILTWILIGAVHQTYGWCLKQLPDFSSKHVSKGPLHSSLNK